MIVEAGRSWILRAKTGCGARGKPEIGWWVGWVEWADGPVFFELNIDMPSGGDDTPKREAIAREILAANERTAAGAVLMAGRTLNADERTFGIVVFVAESEAKAEEFVRNDPAVKHGVMRAELFPYSVALWSRTGPGE